MSAPKDARLSISDLSAAGVRLGPAEAVTIVREVSSQVARGLVPEVPSAHVIRISASGEITIEGPVAAGGRPVSRAAQLLESLLPGFDEQADLHVPGALRLVIARARGTLDLPPYESLESFVAALGRFAPPDPGALIRELVEGATPVGRLQSLHPASAVDAPTLEQRTVSLVPRPAEPADDQVTISDIRRARRATRLTLAEISARSRIPAPLLRELEWGYFRNWPAGHYGRTQLVRYARAAGLDDELVVRTIWPLLEEMAGQQSMGSLAAADGEPLPVAEGEIVDAASGPPASAQQAFSSRPRWGRRALAALAGAAVLAIALLPTLLDRPLSMQAPHPSDRPPAPAGDVAASEPARADASRIVPALETRATAPKAIPPRGEAAVAHAVDPVMASPAFATTGSAMFYRPDENEAATNADGEGGGAILKITSVVDGRANNFHARPSPDGTRIAFDSDRDGERSVYVADSSGHDVRKVSGDGFAALPSWSPDGGRLAFVRAEPDKPEVWNLWAVELGSGAMTRLTSDPSGQPGGGSWFPDGRRIAYTRETDLVVFDTGSGTRRVYHSPKRGRALRMPAVSPDGRRVIFQVQGDGTWLLDVTGGSMRKVLSDPSAMEYAWSPDGRRVAYHSRRSGEWGIWLMVSR